LIQKAFRLWKAKKIYKLQVNERKKRELERKAEKDIEIHNFRI
jgi:hypothetical protein